MSDCIGEICITEEEKNKAIVTFKCSWALAKTKMIMSRIVKRIRKKLCGQKMRLK